MAPGDVAGEPPTATTRISPCGIRRAARTPRLRGHRHQGSAESQAGGLHRLDGRVVPGEGAHVINLNTKFFKGQVMSPATSSATRRPGKAACRSGTSPTRSTRRCSPCTRATRTPEPPAHAFNHIHSVFIWQQQKRAFAVMTDSMEFTDIDIMEITDPRNPVLVSETDANDFGVAREGSSPRQLQFVPPRHGREEDRGAPGRCSSPTGTAAGSSSTSTTRRTRCTSTIRTTRCRTRSSRTTCSPRATPTRPSSRGTTAGSSGRTGTSRRSGS